MGVDILAWVVLRVTGLSNSVFSEVCASGWKPPDSSWAISCASAADQENGALPEAGQLGPKKGRWTKTRRVKPADCDGFFVTPHKGDPTGDHG